MSLYLRFLRLPHVAPLLGAALLGRLPIGINGLAIVLFLRAETGSFAVAGAVAGALSLGTGVGAPVQGRVVDRYGVRTLVPLAVGHAAGLLGVLALGSIGAPLAALLAVAVVTGIVVPPTASVLRVLYPTLLRDDPDLTPTAFALDSVLIEFVFIVGPLLTAALVATVGASVALAVSAAAVLAGTAAFVLALPRSEREAPTEQRERGDLLGALRSPGIRTLVLATLPVGFAFGALEVMIPAFSEEQGWAEAAGVLLAVWSFGSLAGGLAFGARPRRTPVADLHLRIALLLPLGFLPLAAAPSVAVMALLLLPAGALIAPFIATRNELAGAAAPAGAETESYTWPLTALVSGISLGAAAAGWIVDAAGWRAAALLAAGAAVTGAVAAFARRGTLAEGVEVRAARAG